MTRPAAVRDASRELDATRAPAEHDASHLVEATGGEAVTGATCLAGTRAGGDFTCTWFADGAWTRTPLTRTLSWRALADRLTTHRIPAPLPWTCARKGTRTAPACKPKRWNRPGPCPDCGAQLVPAKRALPAWSPWTFRGGVRSTANAHEVCALVVDYDGTATKEAIFRAWAPWRHVAHTTWSHEAGALPRVRVVLPLAFPRPRADWPGIWAWSTERDPMQDTSCSDAGRIAFLPFHHDDREAWTWRHDGPLLHPPALELARPARPAWTPPTGRSHRALREDPNLRRALGVQLGGRVAGEGEGERVEGVPCPACRQDTVWWWVDPAKSWRGCGCRHEKSCGWTGWLDQLEGT